MNDQPNRTTAAGIRHYLSVLRKRWSIIAALTVLGGSAALALSVAATPTYTSVSRVYFSLPTGTSGTTCRRAPPTRRARCSPTPRSPSSPSCWTG